MISSLVSICIPNQWRYHKKMLLWIRNKHLMVMNGLIKIKRYAFLFVETLTVKVCRQRVSISKGIAHINLITGSAYPVPGALRGRFQAQTSVTNGTINATLSLGMLAGILYRIILNYLSPATCRIDKGSYIKISAKVARIHY